MSFVSWRGTVGVIKPTYRPGSLEEFIRLLPEGISVIPLYLGFREGTADEFRSRLAEMEALVKELVEIGVDLLHPEGAPPFMLLGLQGERDLLARWESDYGVPVITSGTTQVTAMRALGLRRIVGVTYFRGQLNEVFAQYFSEAGFEVLAMDGIDVPFDMVGRLSSREVYAHTKAAVLRHQRVDGVYMLGSGWRVLDIVELLEQDLEVPVVHPVPARVWAVQRHFHVRQPLQGYGRLLAEMPAAVKGGG
jgi:maleate cis-trans isomerase